MRKFASLLLPEERALLDQEEGLAGRTFSAARLVQRIEAVTLRLSERARGECDADDNFESVASAVRTLTGALLRLNPQPSEAEQLPAVLGEWRQVWSDSPFTADAGACTVADEICQVVFPDGFYYNLAEITEDDGTLLAGVTRGSYVVNPEFLTVRFTNSFSVVGGYDALPGSFTGIALAAESGELTGDVQRPVSPFDFVLNNVYVDGDLRIVANAADIAEATIVFVLERVGE